MSDLQYQNIYRAATWDDFVGQDHIVKSLKISLDAAKNRNQVVDHILLYGPPGLGKTTLANLVAKSQGGNLRVVSGPSLTRVGDLASILTQLETGDVLFIDEIHSLPKAVEETLYSAMEDFALDMMVGKGPGARSVRIEINQYSLIGATTKAGMIAAPLRDRFGLIHRLDYYDDASLASILVNNAKNLNLGINHESALEIARRSRGTPRIALKLLKRVIDYSLVEHKKTPDIETTLRSLEFYAVDDVGLDETDRRLLRAIITDYAGGPVGLETLAAIISEDVRTITSIYEPFLMQCGFLTKTARGRTVTPKAYTHLKITPP